VTSDLLIQKWSEFHHRNADQPSAKILHFCHSQGTLHTKNALLRLPKEIRDRVIVVAIAPAAVVPKKLCHESFNFDYYKEIDIEEG
jgi:isopentenyl phosphate kinase